MEKVFSFSKKPSQVPMLLWELEKNSETVRKTREIARDQTGSNESLCIGAV